MDEFELDVQTRRRAIETTPENLPIRARLLNQLGIVLKDQFIRTEKILYIEEAVCHAKRAVELSPNHSNHRKYLSDLGIIYGEKFKGTDEMADIDQAIDYMRQAIDSTPKDCPVPARLLNSLGSLFGDRFQRIGEIVDIDTAIKYTQEAVSAVKTRDDTDYARFSGDLGSLYGDRFSSTGDMVDLHRAIENLQNAINFTHNKHPNRSIRLDNLASLLQHRFQVNGEMADLEQAIIFTQQAVSIGEENSRDSPIYLSNLGALLGDRFRRKSEIEDINGAIYYTGKAVDATSEDHPDHAKRLHNLGVLLRELFLQKFDAEGKSADPSDLYRAIQVTSSAVKATSKDDADRVGRLNTLGLLYGDEFRISGSTDNLYLALEYIQEAIDKIPRDHPDVTMWLSNMGSLLHDKYRLTKLKKDLQCVIAAFEKAFWQASGLPLPRVSAGFAAARYLCEEEDWSKAAQIIEQILNLLPEVTPRSSSRDDLQYTLRQLSGLASLASSVYLKAGRTALEALQALEQGRGLIASLMMDSRSDVSTLTERYPELGSRYTKLRHDIAAINQRQTLALQDASGEDYAEMNSDRRRLFKNLHEIQNEIRARRGFERFLLPPTEQEILYLACDGPIINFNVSVISSEAFLITPSQVKMLPLPDLEKESHRQVIDECASRGNSARRDASLFIDDEDEQPVVPDVSTRLHNLWKIAVRPILAELGLLGEKKPGETLPHVWWVDGGIMALAPPHAAGDHSTGSTENTINYVVSSYVSTLKLLQFLRNQTQAAIGELKHKILVVSMPTTPGGLSPLNVVEEVEAIETYTRSWASTTVLERPTKEEVLEKFKTCTIAHFACHGTADPVEPAKSALLLGRKMQEQLSLKDMDNVDHAGAQIAYLSACSTAELKDLNLIDESIHLASAFQLSGFRHVIGTLWGADDGAAVAIAGNFYARLRQNNNHANDDVAYALHNAVMEFRNRDDNCGAISKWAPFIHMGV